VKQVIVEGFNLDELRREAKLMSQLRPHGIHKYKD
jgi:hypothetical protein